MNGEDELSERLRELIVLTVKKEGLSVKEATNKIITKLADLYLLFGYDDLVIQRRQP